MRQSRLAGGRHYAPAGITGHRVSRNARLLPKMVRALDDEAVDPRAELESARTTGPALCSNRHLNRLGPGSEFSTIPRMGSEGLIASLYARRRRLILGLRDFERRAEVYRSAIAEIDSQLQVLRSSVPPFKPRKRNQDFTSREIARGHHDAVREAEGKTLCRDHPATRQGAGCLRYDHAQGREAPRTGICVGGCADVVRPPKAELAASNRKNRPRVHTASPD
jgi:hypothetical protein